MEQHPAYTALEGQEIDGYILSISGIAKCDEDPEVEEIKGSLSGAPEGGKRPLPFSVICSKEELRDPSAVRDILGQIEEQLAVGRSFIRV